MSYRKKFEKIYKIIKKEKNIIIIIVISLLYNGLQYTLIPLIITNDSYDYILLSENLFDFHSIYFGIRTPLYPLIIKCCNYFCTDLNYIIIFQLLLNCISAVLIFNITKFLKNINTAILASLIFIFFPASLFANAILTESLSVFLFILFLYLFIKSKMNNNILVILLTSIVLTLLIFNRPQYLLFLLSLVLFFLIFKYPYRFYLIIFIPIILSFIWIYQVKNVTGICSMSTLIGYNIINHTGKYIEFAPKEYDRLKEIYIKKRDENMKIKGYQEFTIWEVREELQSKLKLNKIELSKLLIQVSLNLIFDHPIKYLSSVWSAMKQTLTFPDYFQNIKNTYYFRILSPFYQLLIGFGLIGGIFIIIKRRVGKFEYHFILLTLLLTNLIASSVFDFGENNRFFIPSYFIIFIWSAISFNILSNHVKSKIVDE